MTPETTTDPDARLAFEPLVRPFFEDQGITIYLGDCRHIMPLLPRFDLLLTDPPYGIGESAAKVKSRQRTKTGSSTALADQRDYGGFDWDQDPVEGWALDLARSLCDKQIIFGGNYYALPPCKGPLVLDKENGANDFADGEMAWNNLGCAMRIKRHMWNGMLRQGGENREHPTQKPLEVIKWALLLAGDVATILDPWAGSGTTGRAALDMGKRAVLIEREERYCEIAANRMCQQVLAL
jgi:site-specific DNA-methyltransferase (adenine-specific)/modification methylase